MLIACKFHYYVCFFYCFDFDGVWLRVIGCMESWGTWAGLIICGRMWGGTKWRFRSLCLITTRIWITVRWWITDWRAITLECTVVLQPWIHPSPPTPWGASHRIPGDSLILCASCFCALGRLGSLLVKWAHSYVVVDIVQKEKVKKKKKKKK